MKTSFMLLIVFLPCIAIADLRCPGGKICPSSQKCCKVNKQYECCDLDVEIPEKYEEIYAGMAMEHTLSPSFHNTTEGVLQNGFFDTCSLSNCPGTCCTSDGCCMYKNAECCSSLRCCPSGNTCCNTGCCPSFGVCCKDGCCSRGYRCCNGWCCKKSQRCGISSFTCINAAVGFTPAFTSFLMVIAALFVLKSNFL